METEFEIKRIIEDDEEDECFAVVECKNCDGIFAIPDENENRYLTCPNCENRGWVKMEDFHKT